jgi:hypothetical protein
MIDPHNESVVPHRARVEAGVRLGGFLVAMDHREEASAIATSTDQRRLKPLDSL